LLSVEAIDLYYGASLTLRRVSLTAKKGEVTCILGRNGVGKASLLRAIFGLQAIRSGRICWAGQILNRLSPHQRARAGLALVPQSREIFPRLTVFENLATGVAPLPSGKCRPPDEIFAFFSVAEANAAPPRRRPLRRSAAAGDSPSSSARNY
jgi:urea transport system ATP-binding protein